MPSWLRSERFFGLLTSMGLVAFFGPLSLGYDHDPGRMPVALVLGAFAAMIIGLIVGFVIRYRQREL